MVLSKTLTRSLHAQAKGYWMFCRNPTFTIEREELEVRLLRCFVKEMRRHFLPPLIIFETTRIFNSWFYSTRIIPSTHPRGNILHTLLSTFFEYVQVVCLWSNIKTQVVLNRGHGYSNRFIPAGVYNLVHTCQPTLNATRLAHFRGCRQRVVDHDS